MSVPVNAVLTPLMVRILNWGVAGASISTVLESVASLIALIIVLKKGKRIIKLTVKKPSVEDFNEIARVGGPKTAEGFFGGMSILLMSIVIVMCLGADALTIHGLAFSIPYLLTVVSNSVSAATQPVSSIAAGKGDLSTMRTSMIFSGILVSAGSISCMILTLAFTDPLLRVFMDSDVSTLENELIQVTRIYTLLIPFYLLS